MKLYRAKTPAIIKWMYPRRLWNYERSENQVYLSFDDGPIPEITPWVLDTLASYNAIATFFCIGDNIRKHPDLFRQVLNNGHKIGNHTFHHLNGWKSSTKDYIQDVKECQLMIEDYRPNESSTLLFRPPYGKLRSRQARPLIQEGYKIVMWDVLSADFDSQISIEESLKNVRTNIQPGSILVFHDSIKAEEKLKAVLPQVLEFIDEKGWTCAPIK